MHKITFTVAGMPQPKAPEPPAPPAQLTIRLAPPPPTQQAPQQPTQSPFQQIAQMAAQQRQPQQPQSPTKRPVSHEAPRPFTWPPDTFEDLLEGVRRGYRPTEQSQRCVGEDYAYWPHYVRSIRAFGRKPHLPNAAQSRARLLAIAKVCKWKPPKR